VQALCYQAQIITIIIHNIHLHMEVILTVVQLEDCYQNNVRISTNLKYFFLIQQNIVLGVENHQSYLQTKVSCENLFKNVKNLGL